MNKKRRETLRALQARLECLTNDFDMLVWEEQDALDNTPESLQNSDRFSDSESTLDDLRTALDSLKDAVSALASISF